MTPLGLRYKLSYMDAMRSKSNGSNGAGRSIYDTCIEVQVIRGVDARGRITSDPVAMVEGDLLVTLANNAKEIVSIYRDLGRDQAMFSA